MNERIKVLTMGVGVQKDRLECALMGWGDRKESWVVEDYVFPGNPNDPDDDCWNHLDGIIRQDFFKPNGQVIRIQVVLIDARFENVSVMNFCERFPYYQNGWRGVYPAYSKHSLSMIVKERNSTIMTPEILIDYQKLRFELYHNLQQHQEVLDTKKLAFAGLYRMYLKYFEILNAKRKACKQKEIRPDWQMFWDLFEDEVVKESAEV